jgi:hypothetical protein
MVNKVNMFATWFLLLLLQPVQSAQSLTPQGLQRKLQTRVENYSLSADSFLQALTKAASQFQIPMGIEWVKEPSTSKSVHLSMKRATVYQVIEALLKGSGHRLEIKRDVVHVFPRGFLSDRRSFLNVRIKRFEVQDEFVTVAAGRLRNIVKRGASQRHTNATQGKPDIWSPGTGTGEARPLVSATSGLASNCGTFEFGTSLTVWVWLQGWTYGWWPILEVSQPPKAGFVERLQCIQMLMSLMKNSLSGCFCDGAWSPR